MFEENTNTDNISDSSNNETIKPEAEVQSETKIPYSQHEAEPQAPQTPYPQYEAQPQAPQTSYPQYGAQPQQTSYPQYGAQPQQTPCPQYGAQPQPQQAPYPQYGAQPQQTPYSQYVAQPQPQQTSGTQTQQYQPASYNQSTNTYSQYSSVSTNDSSTGQQQTPYSQYGAQSQSQQVPYSQYGAQFQPQQASGAQAQQYRPASYNQSPNTYSQYSSVNTNGSSTGQQQTSDTKSDFLTGYTNYTDNQYGYTTASPQNSRPGKEKSKAAKFFSGLGLAAAFGVVAAGMFLVTLLVYNKINPEDSPDPVQPVSVITQNESSGAKLNLDDTTSNNDRIAATTVLDSARTTATDVSAVVDECMPSIVSINTVYDYESFWGVYETEGAGSGIIIEKKDDELLIATNNHVIQDSKAISVCFADESTAQATIKGTDSVADLAVISVKISDIKPETLSTINVARLGSSDDIKVGQMAIAIGNALGYGQSVTVGYISAKDREVDVETQKMVLLQTDAAINPGNSGGALINLDGEVIGINSVKYADSTVEGMGFAIPISRAQDILAELATREVLSEEEKGYLGIYINDVTEAIAKEYNWPVGVYISKITEGGAAEASELQVSDIITAVNGSEIKTTKQLIDRISSMRYGTEITLTVQRLISGSFEEFEITVVLGRNPEAAESSVEGTDEKSEGKKAPKGGKSPEIIIPEG